MSASAIGGTRSATGLSGSGGSGLGCLNGTLIVAGRQGHAAYPERADNPIPKLIRLLDALTAAPLDNGTPHFEPSHLEIVSVDVGNPAFSPRAF